MRVRRVVIVVLSVAVLGVTGCGADGSSSSAGVAEQTPAGSASESPSARPSETPSQEVPEDTYADVEPATGPVMEMESVRARLPEGWKLRKTTDQLHSGGYAGQYVALNEVAPVVPRSFDEEARSSRTGRVDAKRLDRTENVWIDGREWFTVEGWSTSRGYYIVEHGIPLSDSLVGLTFVFPSMMPVADRAGIMEPVIASLEWR